ncbi:MAG TPA: NADH-quinone oxidoreductase subunit J [Clostridia bacterium]|nr:NADH-quinone oxidoreductase subunit J [Clostridia bacterium]
MVTSIVFYAVAALIIFAALKMVLSTNLVHSALFMAIAFACIAIIYLLLNADYLAVVQVMVYVGAITILFVFGVMLTKREYIEKSSQFNRYKVYGAIVAAALFIVFALNIFNAKFTLSTAVPPDSTINAISSLLLNDYSIAFQVVGVLLLVATIGAIVIGKGVKSTR